MQTPTDFPGLLEPFAPLFAEADKAPYEQGARHGAGSCLAVARPSSEAQIQTLAALCERAGVALVVQGANTSLCGAAIPDARGTTVVLSTERLRDIHDLSVEDMTVRAAAGTRLSALNDWLEPHGLWFPIDLGADPSIGGMVATNTGGSRLIRYGDVRSRVCGLRVIAPASPGEVLQFGRGLHKDNTGLDLKQLLIGSSGSLGIVTEATLRLARLPRQSVAALLAIDDPAQAATVFRSVAARCDGLLSAFEGISGAALDLALNHVPGLQRPFTQAYPYCVLLELSTAQAESDFPLEPLMLDVLEAELGRSVRDAVIGRADQLWGLRHSLTEGARHAGRVIAFDVSVRRDRLPRFLREARALAADALPAAVVADFGHWGDGGVHFNLVVPHGRIVHAREVECTRRRLYDLVVIELGGSFSAEHGVGPANACFYETYTPATALRLAGAVQRAFNPGLGLGTVRFAPEVLA